MANTSILYPDDGVPFFGRSPDLIYLLFPDNLKLTIRNFNPSQAIRTETTSEHLFREPAFAEPRNKCSLQDLIHFPARC
jgi:hypothetical protein